MPKAPDESYLDYKKRMIDPVSSSFCAAKWLNATIWLDQGKTTSCHLPICHPISRWEILFNPSAIHNTRHKKLQREKMLKGERPEECDYCWKIEDMNRDAVSDRVFKTVIFKDEDVKALPKKSAKANVNPRTLEISFDRTCNFACSYCNVDFSTKWLKDLKTHGLYENLRTFDSYTYKHYGSASHIKDASKNPYIKAFWRWWPELSQDLEELRITGGEPLMSPDVWKLFDDFIKNPKPNLRFAINSNLGGKDDLIERLIEKSQGVRHLEIYTSMEAVGAHAEYIRDGLEYSRWRNNVLKIIKRAKVHQINMMMTVNALCLFTLTDLFDEILGWREEMQRKFAVWTLNILRFPSFMSPLILPEEIRFERAAHLRSWLNANISNSWLHEMEIAAIERLIGYLEVVETPHARASSQALRESDFKSFFSQYDRRRGKDFKKTFPMLAAWYDSLELLPTSVEDRRGASAQKVGAGHETGGPSL
jgi:organic radical activating enzyme